MKLTTLFTFLVLTLAVNSQAQNIVFSNAEIGEDVTESTQTEFMLGEDEIFQRAHFTDFVTNLYECRRCGLSYFNILLLNYLIFLLKVYVFISKKVSKNTKKQYYG